MSLSFNDFQKQDIKFDITKLREACTKVLNLKGFDTSLGRERIRQIEAKALRKLRHPSRSSHLKSFLDE